MSNKYAIMVVSENYIQMLSFDTSEELYATWNSIKQDRFTISKEPPAVEFLLIDCDKKTNLSPKSKKKNPKD